MTGMPAKSVFHSSPNVTIPTITPVPTTCSPNMATRRHSGARRTPPGPRVVLGLPASRADRRTRLRYMLAWRPCALMSLRDNAREGITRAANCRVVKLKQRCDRLAVDEEAHSSQIQGITVSASTTEALGRSRLFPELQLGKRGAVLDNERAISADVS